MEKKQYELCIEVLRRLSDAGVLKDLILIGSWCAFFFRAYFTNAKYLPSIKTRDIDFLIPIPQRIHSKVDLSHILRDLGFVVGFKGSQGYMRLEHPELIVEFLVPERGKGLDKPYPLPQLGLNAQALRFLDLLSQSTIHLEVEGIPIVLPHPANFAVHKLLVSQRRMSPEKQFKDKEMGIKMLRILIEKGETDAVKKALNLIAQRRRMKLLKELEKTEGGEFLSLLK